MLHGKYEIKRLKFSPRYRTFSSAIGQPESDRQPQSHSYISILIRYAAYCACPEGAWKRYTVLMGRITKDFLWYVGQ